MTIQFHSWEAHLFSRHGAGNFQSQWTAFVDTNRPHSCSFAMRFVAALSFMTALLVTKIGSLPPASSDYPVSPSLDNTKPNDINTAWSDSQTDGITSSPEELAQDIPADSDVFAINSEKQDIAGSGGSIFNPDNFVASTDANASTAPHCGGAQTNGKLRLRDLDEYCAIEAVQDTTKTSPMIKPSLSRTESPPISIPVFDKEPNQRCEGEENMPESLCCPGKQVVKPGWERKHYKYYAVLVHCRRFCKSFHSS